MDQLLIRINCIVLASTEPSEPSEATVMAHTSYKMLVATKPKIIPAMKDVSSNKTPITMECI